MRLRMFHAGDGDCVLLSSPDDHDDQDAHHILVDGGRKGAFETHALPTLSDLPQLDLVCVSHIDEDHIAGILAMLEVEIDWRVHDFRKQAFADGHGPKPTTPSKPRPPAIREIWHNALFELVGDDLEVEVQGALTASASLMAGATAPQLQALAEDLDNLATGERSALELSRRISSNQLAIPRNRPLDTVMIRGQGNDTTTIGTFKAHLLGPSQEDIDALRVRWDEWINNHRSALERLRTELRRDEDRLGSLGASLVANPLKEGLLGDGLSGVSEPNLASLMLLVEDGKHRVLLTGDGVSSEIFDGLAHHGKLDGQGRIHVDVLKVQHHGALANVEEQFVQRVTANHYLFCGNGAHHNPELAVVKAFAHARLEGIEGAAPVEPDKPFTFWFSTSPIHPSLAGKKGEGRRDHMSAVKTVAQAIMDDDRSDRFQFHMLEGSHLEIPL